ncbi:acyl-CoA dehydrogenase family protein [Aeromicrobium ginsengisoli]|uniref:Acyl-CoA dehydrogenase n=1 Tax=Aeromicrobium ginsengisoli TaxID=363867 RepID=A0A5M4FEV3_9ACTN|nr:acyl-CoA dehydrogenase family protein [Aeromicrobium ginsengisoli]KAA1397656.1 acyl-CoA dehydrogenase [Aeromicrobium ginsengisoli]
MPATSTAARTFDAAPAADPSILTPVPEHDDLREIVRAVVAKADGTWDRLMSELEIGSLAVPEALSGAGFGLREVGVVLEETGAALLPDPVLTSAVVAVQAVIAADQPADDLLEAISSGREVATVTWASPHDVRATPSGDGWTLVGTTERIPHAETAQHLIVPATTDAGTALFVVDLRHDAVTTRTRQVLDDTRPLADVSIAKAPARLLVGPERFDDVWHTVQTAGAIGVAAEHTGMATHLLETTTAYLLERQQFGRAIASFQAIKHRLADLLVDLERARSASRYAAAIFDADPEAATLPARIAAAVCQDVVIRAAHESVQLHGGIGFTWEHTAHLYVRRALGDEGLFGSSRAHRAAIADLVGL